MALPDITPEIRESTNVARGSLDKPQNSNRLLKRLLGIFGGIALGAIVYYAFPRGLSDSLVEALTKAAQSKDPAAVIDPVVAANNIAFTAAVAALMAVWWIFEAIPLAATALVPLVTFPLFGVATFKATATPYASDTIFLFMGGFFLALAMQRWNFHRRLAFVIVLLIGTKPKRMVLGFMVATGFLSMWVSNTATAVMMLPIGISVLTAVGQVETKDGKMSNFGTALMLGIAYAASIASLSTLIGTPPNALLRGYLQESHDITLNFGQWMLFATPLAWLFLLIAWQLLIRLYKPEMEEIPGGRELIRRQLKEMGPMSAQEKIVMIVFICAALAWIIIPTFWPDGPISDAYIAMAVALILFLTPAHLRPDGIPILDWESAKEIPWDVLLLFGGGLSLAGMFGTSGLSNWIGDKASGMAGAPIIVIVAVLAAMVIFLTELTSNTATAAAFLPIIGSVAIGMGVDVQLLVIPVALAATCAFMLPVATPPNAIAFGSGYIKIKQMVKAGLWLNLIGIVLITLWTMYLGPLTLGYGI
ncbi:MAG: DASS family sodium-coupled anion symporter [Actinomycetaceae bacterium]|nr:DASS family sodium-coupled anion symporter [Actinomycetaceae bacterium]MDY5855141.1 DASS family sodium-coupled anion symporter [Arcanobacterium sp.]